MPAQHPPLAELKRRWDMPLLRPGSLEPTIVDGCATFQDLLGKAMRDIREALAARPDAQAPARGHRESRDQCRKAWKESAQARFLELVRRLGEHGLERGPELEAGRYRTGEAVDLRGGDFRAGSFRGAPLENVHFQGADLRGVCFEGARCIETRFEHALCEEASFASAECQFSDFRSTSCDRASFAGADCTMARFQGARLRQADYAGCTCFAAQFDGAFLHNAAIPAMKINHYTGFGKPGEQREAERSRALRSRERAEEDWFITHLNPHWLKAAEVNAGIRSLLKASGDFLAADRYQYQEMVCRRHLIAGRPVAAFFEWFFKDRIFGYGLKWHRPLITILVVVMVWGAAFALHLHRTAGQPLAQSLGNGFYYSIICLTTLGLGNLSDLSGFWAKFLVCSEALTGAVLMPVFLLAYARKILQN